MEPQRRQAPNVFELLTENAQLREHIAQLEQALILAAPDDGEEVFYSPAGTLASHLAHGPKEALAVYYTHARRERGGKIVFSDDDLAAALGTQRRCASRFREALAALDLVECESRNAKTGKWTIRVASAAQAFDRIRLRVAAIDPQMRILFLDEQDGAHLMEATGEAPRAEGVDPPPARMGLAADERTREECRPHDAPPPASLVAEFRQARGQSRAQLSADNQARTNVRGQMRAQMSAAAGPEHGESVSPACVRACAPDTFSNTRHFQKETASESVARLAFSESVQCPRSAQDVALSALWESTAAIVGAAIDPAQQTQRAAEISRLMADLIRLGGQCPPDPGYPGDGRLTARAARNIASAVVAGWLDWEGDVLRLLDDGATKALQEKTPAPWVYLVGTYRKILIERERPVPPRGKPR